MARAAGDISLRWVAAQEYAISGYQNLGNAAYGVDPIKQHHERYDHAGARSVQAYFARVTSPTHLDTKRLLPPYLDSAKSFLS